MRVCCIISYDGSKFQGFQQQPFGNTVINAFLSVFEKLNIQTQIVGSGRTDKGVHANNQVLHFDVPSFWSNFSKLKKVLNYHLHPFIDVKKVVGVEDKFHARHCAKKREYRYILCHDTFNPFKDSYVHFYPHIDIQRLNLLLKLFKGEHNFEMFKKSGSDIKNFIRVIYSSKAYRHKNHTIIILQANGFLRSQVRMIVGILLLENEGKITQEAIIEQLHCKKQHTKVLAPPNGLYLHRVFY